VYLPIPQLIRPGQNKAMKKNIEAVENAIRFLEELGYVGGNIHDELVLTFWRLREHEANMQGAREIGKRYAAGLPGLTIANAESTGRAAYEADAEGTRMRVGTPHKSGHGVLCVDWNNLGDGWQLYCLCGWVSSPDHLMERVGLEFDCHLAAVQSPAMPKAKNEGTQGGEK
jgi:hypothetical protein